MRPDADSTGQEAAVVTQLTARLPTLPCLHPLRVAAEAFAYPALCDVLLRPAPSGRRSRFLARDVDADVPLPVQNLWNSAGRATVFTIGSDGDEVRQ